MVFHSPYPRNIHRMVTEGQRITMDCFHLLESFRHILIGKSQYFWLKNDTIVGKSAKLVFMANQSAQATYRCVVIAPVGGEPITMMRQKTIHLTVKGESPCFNIEE